MPLVYLTGISGSGKSEALKELRRRGYEVHGTDEDGIAAYFDNQTGEALVNPPATAAERTPEWRQRHTWKMKREQVEAIVPSQPDRLVFLCGCTANEDEMWDLFAGVIALVVDEDTLVHRIKTRTNNNFGQVDHEMAAILEWQGYAEADYRKHGVTTIDSTRPISTVVDDVVEMAETLTGMRAPDLS